MTTVGARGDGMFGVILASGALKELFRNVDPTELEQSLQKGTGVSDLARLRAVLTQLDVLDEPGRVNPLATAVARDVIGTLARPQAFVGLLSKILGTDSKTLSNLVAERLGKGTVVSKDEFASRTANVSLRRHTADDLAALKVFPETLRALGVVDPTKGAPIFLERYQALTGADVVFEPRSIAALYRDHGPHILGHLKRPVRLALLPSTTVEARDLERFSLLSEKLFEEIDRHGMTPTTAVLAGFTATGANGVFYSAAQKLAVELGGIADASLIASEPAFVHRGTIFGTAPGDAQALFSDLAASAMLVSVTPSATEKEQLIAHCKCGGVAIVLHAGELHDPTLDVRGILQLSLTSDPAEVAAVAAQYLRAKQEDRSQQAFVSAAEHMAMSKAPSEINEIRQWAREESSRYRLVRLQNAAIEKLASAHPGVSVAKLSGWALEIGRNISRFTHGVDNFRDNAHWQAQAKAAIAESGPESAAIADKLAMDVMFASWFGIREFNEAPSYFDEHAAPLAFPEALDRLSGKAEHTFDKDAYAEVRLDHITTKFLAAEDSKPEVFLGSREEMQLYYRARGFELDCTTHDSNGTEFHYFRSQDEAKPSIMVMHGVDSEARLLQLSALMRVNGVDPRRCIVRGEMSRVREVNASLLEHRLMEITANGDLQRDIAGVVVGNKNEAISALAAAAGVDPSSLAVTEHRAGPFRFRSVEVRSGDADTPPKVFLAFAPAYGQLSEDLVQACARIGSAPPAFMIAGAGGSLDRRDAINDVHQVTGVLYGEQTIRFDDAASSVQLIRVDGARDAINVFSPTPLEQDQAWLTGVLASVAGKAERANVDQEVGPIFGGMARAAEAAKTAGKDHRFFIQSTLVQSDVVGSGGLAHGTVDNSYGARILGLAKHFVGAIGINSVAVADGFAAITSSVTPVLQPRRAATSLGATKVEVPKMDTAIATWKSSADQFKGQKVPYRIVAEKFGPDEEAFMQKLLTTLNPADIWIVVDAADANNHKIRDAAKRYEGALSPHSARIRDLAEKYGFQTIVMALESEKASIRGSLDFLLSYTHERTDDGRGKLDTIEHFIKHGNAEEDPSYAVPRTIVLGARTPPLHAVGAAPFGLSEAELQVFIDIVERVHAKHADGEQDPKRLADKLIAERANVLADVAAIWGQGAPDALQRTTEVFEFLRERARLTSFVYTGGLDADRVRDTVAAMAKDVQMPFEGGVQMFADGLTHRFPGLKNALADHARGLMKSGALRPLPARTGEAQVTSPRFYPLDGIGDFLRVAGTERLRIPLLWAGASRSSWPNLSPDAQRSLHLFVEVMAKILAGDKDKYAMVTGGTKWGFEDIVHEVFARDGWHILGTLSQNVEMRADKWEPDARVWHWVVPAINYFGVSRPVAEDIVRRYDGKVVNVAGGAIALDQIGLHLALNLDAWQMTGLPPSTAALTTLTAKLQAKADKAAAGKAPPVVLTDEQRRWAAGASVQMGEKYPARAFDTLDTLCEGMGLGEQLRRVKAKLGITDAVSIMAIEAMAAKLGVDTAAIAARYPSAP